MTYTLDNDTEQIQQWAFKNRINLYSAQDLDIICWNNFDLDEESFPQKIELEFEIEEPSTTTHSYGSTIAVEHHPPEVLSVTYNGKELDVPDWLASQLIEQAENQKDEY